MAERAVPLNVRVLIMTFPEDAPRGAVTRFCAEYGISRSWFYELRARMAEQPGVVTAVLPRSRAPKSNPRRISAVVADLACEIREKLAADGWDHGPLSVLTNIKGHNVALPSRSALAQLFAERGLVTPQPQKRPRASYRRYSYPLPNMLWCSDGMDYRLADGKLVKVLQLMDDCSRYDLGPVAAHGETSPEIRAMLAAAIGEHGVPQRFLTDNGAAYNPSRRGHLGQVESWLRNLGVEPITCRPGHPQGNGKAERVHQTLQKWLEARPPAASIADLQSLLDTYQQGYNNRAHQSLPAMATPHQIWDSLPHAEPPEPPATLRVRDRVIKVSPTGNVTARPHGTVNIGKPHADEHVIVITDQETISILDKLGTFIRTVTIEPGRTYYGLKPKPPTVR